jgi:hypothetical protein
MNQGGWEIRPFGWIVLILIIGLLGYLLLKWLQRPSTESPTKRNPLSA